MAENSKWFDGIRVSGRGKAGGKKGAAKAAPERLCEYPGCDKPGTHKAPRGRGQEGQFYYFCMDHVREYNKSYNYFSGMAADDVAAYQKDAALGHRPTWKMGERGKRPGTGRNGKTGKTFAYEDPINVLGEDGVEIETPSIERRQLLAQQRRAFETLDLDEAADGELIRTRFKALVKKHHPDVNGGDKSSEHRLREVIQAYNTLKAGGFC
ncbi:MAG: J domain-containing protein [Pseudomonadota bacterium]